MSSLSHLSLGQKAEIVSFEIYGKNLIRFMEMGLACKRNPYKFWVGSLWAAIPEFAL